MPHLPSSAFFTAGNGPLARDLMDDLEHEGFTNVHCHHETNLKAEALTIQVPGQPEQQISPDGENPGDVDAAAEITICLNAVACTGG